MLAIPLIYLTGLALCIVAGVAPTTLPCFTSAGVDALRPERPWDPVMVGDAPSAFPVHRQTVWQCPPHRIQAASAIDVTPYATGPGWVNSPAGSRPSDHLAALVVLIVANREPQWERVHLDLGLLPLQRGRSVVPAPGRDAPRRRRLPAKGDPGNVGYAVMVPPGSAARARPGHAHARRRTAARAAPPTDAGRCAMKLLWLGTYERDYTRTRVLMAGLREVGVEVVECHRPLWELTRHKAGSFLSPTRLPALAARLGGAWGGIALEQRHLRGVEAIVAGYPYMPDALPAWVFAHGRRVPLVADALISISDTLAGDRARVGPAVGGALAALDTVMLRAADVVIADTYAHAEFYAARFGVARDRVGVVRVGAEAAVFRPAPPPPGRPRTLFYGKLSPLHGLDTLLAAARMPGTPPVRVIGDGQLGDWLAEELRRDEPPGFEHVPWVEYELLGEELARAGICLGVFGRSEKASRVVPNKVYHAMAVGRPVITADTSGAREVLEHERTALLVPAGDAPALAAAMRRLDQDEGLRVRLGEAARERFLEVASQRVVARDFLAALERGTGLTLGR